MSILPKQKESTLRNLETGKPGTVVVIFNGNNDEEEIRRLIKRDIHVILADRQTTIENTSSIGYDNREVIYHVIRQLKGKNYQVDRTFDRTDQS